MSAGILSSQISADNSGRTQAGGVVYETTPIFRMNMSTLRRILLHAWIVAAERHRKKYRLI